MQIFLHISTAYNATSPTVSNTVHGPQHVYMAPATAPPQQQPYMPYNNMAPPHQQSVLSGGGHPGGYVELPQPQPWPQQAMMVPAHQQPYTGGMAPAHQHCTQNVSIGGEHPGRGG